MSDQSKACAHCHACENHVRCSCCGFCQNCGGPGPFAQPLYFYPNYIPWPNWSPWCPPNAIFTLQPFIGNAPTISDTATSGYSNITANITGFEPTTDTVRNPGPAFFTHNYLAPASLTEGVAQ